MPRVLNSIALTAPAAPVSANVSDTFAFTGTPGFTGSGGVTRYDFRWEVDNGGGYTTIAASGSGLTTGNTNPLVNTNSSTANSITVSCDTPGTYTIRMVGAPTTGGSYTVLSATQSVTVSAASQSLTPSLFTSATNAFFAAAITTGAVALTPALFTNEQTFFAPTVTQQAASQGLTPTLVTNTSTFYEATVAVGAVDLTPALVANSQTFHAPAISVGAVGLTPSLYSNTSTFYAPTITTAVDLTPSLYTNAHTFFAPTVGVGAVALTPSLFTNSQTFYAPTVSADGQQQDLTAPLLENNNTFFAPTVVAAAVTEQAPRFQMEYGAVPTSKRKKKDGQKQTDTQDDGAVALLLLVTQ